MIRTGVFDATGEIELTSDSRVQVRQGERVLFSAHPERVLPAECDGDVTVILLRPAETANQPIAPAWRNGVYIATSRFTFHNGGGWSAEIEARL